MLTPVKKAITTSLIQYMDKKGFNVGLGVDGQAIIQPQRLNQKFLTEAFSYDVISLVFVGRKDKIRIYWTQLDFFNNDKDFIVNYNPDFESVLEYFKKEKISLAISDFI